MNGSRLTQLAQQLARLRDPFRADLHLHTHFSDGTHTPEDLIARATAAKLGAIAVTDHDTTAGVIPVRRLALSRPTLEVIAGVEITATWRDREVHLLAYFIDVENLALQDRLKWVRDGRRDRAAEIARRVFPATASVEERITATPADVALGRRHIARWLMEAKLAGSLHDAFTRVLNRPDIRDVPKRRLPLEEAITLAHAAGGVCSFAHPPEETTRETLADMQAAGLDAVEAEYPRPSRAPGQRLRAWAAELGLLVTGGSDSHDPAPATRNVGVRAISRGELDKLRAVSVGRAFV